VSVPANSVLNFWRIYPTELIKTTPTTSVLADQRCHGDDCVKGCVTLDRMHFALGQKLAVMRDTLARL
jgi:hypothetical protein